MVDQDVGPRVRGCCAVVFPYGREIEAEFVVWGVQSSSWEFFGEAQYFAASGL